ncbi:hypothetical protein KI387_023410, partial [Taxus chinensis]
FLLFGSAIHMLERCLEQWSVGILSNQIGRKGVIVSGVVKKINNLDGHVPVYIAEIAPKHLRGGLGAVNMAKIGKDVDFEASLQTLRGFDSDIYLEAIEIRSLKKIAGVAEMEGMSDNGLQAMIEAADLNSNI